MSGVPEDIKEHLKTLNLPISKIPSVGDVRQAYKALLRNHPDKAGAAATELFQSVTEAVRLILEYLTLNPAPDESNKCEKDDDAALLKLFGARIVWGLYVQSPELARKRGELFWACGGRHGAELHAEQICQCV